MALYTDVATILNVDNVKYSLIGITRFIVNLPFHPIILISLFLCIGIILIIGNILLLFNNYQNISKSSEIKNIISDILNQHINDDEVTDENMHINKKQYKHKHWKINIIWLFMKWWIMYKMLKLI